MHGIQTINAINSRNAEAERIMREHGHTDFTLGHARPAARGFDTTPSAYEDRYAKTDRVGHGSVQPWSAGGVFPGVVTTFGDGTHQGQFRGVESERFATYAQAENWILSRKAEFSKGVAAH